MSSAIMVEQVVFKLLVQCAGATHVRSLGITRDT